MSEIPTTDENIGPGRNVPPFDFSNPTKECDIVMKGGVTSGIVYPLAVCQLAQTYTFCSIGGTSAGAIAAAATAAAELGRRKKRGGGFEQLAQLPAWLGGSSPDGSGSNLLGLFQPDDETRPLFSLVRAALGAPEGRLDRLLDAGTRTYPLWALAGMLPGLILIASALMASGVAFWAPLAIGILLSVIGMPAGILLGALLDARRRLPENNYGLCRGNTRDGDGPEPIMSWMHGYLNELAGKPLSEGPLTFGDLWDLKESPNGRAIDLQMMATNLTHGKPYRLPFTAPNRGDTRPPRFYFKEEDLRMYFPEDVVSWMVEHSEQSRSRTSFPSFLPLPLPEDVPVVVAARMSLSFPVLFSAVPLYAVDYSRKEKAMRVPELCLFADGGICSNFPVHFFDAPIPGRPTFAINLRPFHMDYPCQKDQHKNIWSPNHNGQGILNQWSRLDGRSGLGAVGGFLGLIMNTMQNWSDNAQLSVPGYRDRIVHVYQREDEGGMNLEMDAVTIATLAERGRCAGARLQERFTSTSPKNLTSWDNHRWVRYRSSMAQLETYLMDLLDVCQRPSTSGPPYIQLITRSRTTAPTSYRWRNEAQKAFALQATNDLLAIARRWQQTEQTFVKGAPKPDPELRTRPKL